MDSILQNRQADWDFIENESLSKAQSHPPIEEAEFSGIEVTLHRGLNNLRAMVTQYKSQIQELKNELEQAKSKSQNSEAATQMLRQAFDQQLNELTAYSHELEQKVGKLNREIQKTRESAANEKENFAKETQLELALTKKKLEQSEAQLSSVAADFGSRLKSMSAVGLQLEAEIQGLKTELSKTKAELSSKDEALKSLRSGAEQREKYMKGREAQLLAQIASQDEWLKEREMKIAASEARVANITADYGARLKSMSAVGLKLEAELASKDQALRALRGSVAEKEKYYQSQIEQSQRDLKAREAKMAQMEEDFANRLASMSGVNFEIEAKTLRADLTRFRKNSEMVERDLKERLEQAASKLNETEFALRNKERDMLAFQLSTEQEKDRASRLEKELKDLNSRLRTSVESVKLKDARIEKLQREIDDCHSRIEQRDITLQSLNETVESLNLEIQRLEMSKFEIHRMPLMQKDLKAKDDQIATLTKDLAAAHSALEAIRSEKDNSQQLISNLQSEVQRLSIEAALAQQLAKSGEARHAIEVKELRDAQEKLKKRETQLQSYAAILSNEKEELAKSAEVLASELHSAKTLHPLRDYLDLTDRELTRLEIQLKKTPVSSPDRAQLESFVDQLIEQKKFLETVIDESEKSLMEQAGSLRNKTEAKKPNVSVPKLPPKSG